MKIIDLLNKIANGEEDDLITEFEFDKRVWNFKGLNDSEFCLDGWLLNQNITITKHKEILEKKKIPERVPNAEVFEAPRLNNMELSHIALTNKEDIKIIKETLNSILKYLKSKGE